MFWRITFRGHGELLSALLSGTAAAAGGQRLNFGLPTIIRAPPTSPTVSAVRQHDPDVLEPAEQCGHEPRALTEVGCSVRPRVSLPPRASLSDIEARTMCTQPLVGLPAGKKRQP